MKLEQERAEAKARQKAEEEELAQQRATADMEEARRTEERLATVEKEAEVARQREAAAARAADEEQRRVAEQQRLREAEAAPWAEASALRAREPAALKDRRVFIEGRGAAIVREYNKSFLGASMHTVAVVAGTQDNPPQDEAARRAQAAAAGRADSRGLLVDEKLVLDSGANSGTRFRFLSPAEDAAWHEAEETAKEQAKAALEAKRAEAKAKEDGARGQGKQLADEAKHKREQGRAQAMEQAQRLKEEQQLRRQQQQEQPNGAAQQTAESGASLTLEQRRQYLEARLVAFYGRHNPQKLEEQVHDKQHGLRAIVKYYTGRGSEAELNEALFREYQTDLRSIKIEPPVPIQAQGAPKTQQPQKQPQQQQQPPLPPQQQPPQPPPQPPQPPPQPPLSQQPQQQQGANSVPLSVVDEFDDMQSAPQQDVLASASAAAPEDAQAMVEQRAQLLANVAPVQPQPAFTAAAVCVLEEEEDWC